MLFQIFIVPATLAALANAGLARRFTYGDTPTGTVDPGVIKDCTLWATIQAGDTCSSVYTYFDITEQQFVSYNPALQSDCSGLTVGHSYCVEENYGLGPQPSTTTTMTPKPTTTGAPSPTQTGLIKTCTAFYQVKSGDTCQGIVNSYATFTLSQFYSWNPAVGSNCASLLSGYYVCVGVPGTPTTKPTTPTPSSSGPLPEQTGITKSCDKYYKVVSGDTCQSIVNKFAISSLQLFYTWNPAVGSECATLLANYYVCVGATGTPTTTTHSTGPSPTQSGIVQDCTKYYKAVSGDTCDIIANEKFKTFTVATFEKWNPAVGPDCTKLLAGDYYCVAVPGTPTTPITTTTPPRTTVHGPQPQESGTISSCTNYYKVVSGDTCDGIESKFRITAAQFNAWNTGVGTECHYLYAGYYVCVGV